MSASPPLYLAVAVHMLAILNLGVGYMLYVDPDYYMTPATAPLEWGIVTTCLEDNRIDDVSVFLFRGEGAMKLALSVYTLVLSKIMVRGGYATHKQAIELAAASFLGLFLPAIPVWSLNTGEQVKQEGVFDPQKYKDMMIISTVFCIILATGLYQSRTSGDSRAATSVASPLSRFFPFLGVIVGLQLLYDPRISIGPQAALPFFRTTQAGGTMDAVMMYAGRMSGANHFIFAATLWFSYQSPTLAASLNLAMVTLFYPLDVSAALAGEDSVLNAPLFWVFTALHTVAIGAFVQTIRSAQKVKQE